MSRIFVFFGMIASGKSYLASRWAETEHCSYYNSDIVRKELAGLRPKESGRASFGEGLYSREYTEKTYEQLFVHAENAVKSGQDCILDGSFSSIQWRERLCERTLPVVPVFIYCFCSEEIIKNRLRSRMQDRNAVSDGTWDIYLMQKENFQHPEETESGEFISLDTNKTIEELLALLTPLRK